MLAAFFVRYNDQSPNSANQVTQISCLNDLASTRIAPRIRDARLSRAVNSALGSRIARVEELVVLQPLK